MGPNIDKDLMMYPYNTTASHNIRIITHAKRTGCTKQHVMTPYEILTRAHTATRVLNQFCLAIYKDMSIKVKQPVLIQLSSWYCYC